MTAMSSQVEELPENRVRLTVEVSVHDLKHAVEHAADDLAGSVKIPGFRKGKVPMAVLVSRVGKDRLYAEAVESHIGGWFWSAAGRSRLRPVAQPEFDYELPASSDAPWSFTATVPVQPKPDLPDWKELEVPRAEPDIPAEVVDYEVDRLRSVAAATTPVDGRPAQPGDTLVVDLVSEGGEAQRDYVVELGAGRLLEEIEEALTGMSAGESKDVQYETSDDTRRNVAIALKQVHEKVLPPADDDLARSVSEFQTLDELRASIEATLREQLEVEVEAAFRQAAVDELVKAASVEAAGPLVESRTRELLQGFIRSIEGRGVSVETYLAMTGRTPEELVATLQTEAAQSVAREIVLDAVAEKAGISVGDEQVEELVREQAGDEDPAEVIEQLKHSGQFEQLREDLRMRDALDRVAAEVKPISTELAEARGAIWTPEQEKPAEAAKLWTPGSSQEST
jgi:trigger factor